MFISRFKSLGISSYSVGQPGVGQVFTLESGLSFGVRVAVDECVGAYDAHSGEVAVFNALPDTVLIDGFAEIVKVVSGNFLVSDGLVGLFGILEFARGGS